MLPCTIKAPKVLVMVTFPGSPTLIKVSTLPLATTTAPVDHAACLVMCCVGRFSSSGSRNLRSRGWSIRSVCKRFLSFPELEHSQTVS